MSTVHFLRRLVDISSRSQKSSKGKRKAKREGPDSPEKGPATKRVRSSDKLAPQMPSGVERPEPIEELVSTLELGPEVIAACQNPVST